MRKTEKETKTGYSVQQTANILMQINFFSNDEMKGDSQSDDNNRSDLGKKNKEIPSTKIPIKRTCRKFYIDSRCTLMVMIHGKMTWAICCRNSFSMNRNGS